MVKTDSFFATETVASNTTSFGSSFEMRNLSPSVKTCIFFKFYFIFKLYIIVLVLPNIKMNPPQVYMCSPSWTLLPPPTPYHPSGSSQCTSPKHPVSCIEPGLATRFIHDILHVSMPRPAFLTRFLGNQYSLWGWRIPGLSCSLGAGLGAGLPHGGFCIS